MFTKLIKVVLIIIREGYEVNITGEADQIIVKWIVQSVKLSGGWFGLGADEGRAKLRNVPGRRKEPRSGNIRMGLPAIRHSERRGNPGN